MPSVITEYLNTKYNGYTAQRAFTVKDSSGAAAGYIVIPQFNNSPVGLTFDASGNFVKVLEQLLGRELEGCMNSDSTFVHREHPFDSAHVYTGYDSTHVQNDVGDSTHLDNDSTHHHHH